MQAASLSCHVVHNFNVEINWAESLLVLTTGVEGRVSTVCHIF